MRRYNCFLLDARGAIRGAEPIAAATDADAWQEAILLLRARPHFRDVEVWERSRRTENGQYDGAGGYGPADLSLRRLPRPDGLRRPRG